TELKELGDRNRVVRADVTDSADNRRLAGTVEEEFGRLDVLVNNVGVDGSAPFSEISGEEWQRLLDYNVTPTRPPPGPASPPAPAVRAARRRWRTSRRTRGAGSRAWHTPRTRRTARPGRPCTGPAANGGAACRAARSSS
ncbi:SDR family NAD(P)-dependent oxidoreductase, partial [Nonomuraea sp. NPDC004297]